MSHEHSHEHGCCHGATTAAQSFDEMDFERGIWNAALYNDMDRLKKLLEHTSANAEDQAGYTALHYAARSGHLKICQELLNRGALVNARTKAGGVTPLQRAVSAGHTDVVKLLLEHEADISIKDNDGNNAIHRAIASDKIDVIRILLQNRPDLKNVKNGKNQLPADLTKNEAVLELLE